MDLKGTSIYGNFPAIRSPFSPLWEKGVAADEGY
jgi:hypothetical protein